MKQIKKKENFSKKIIKRSSKKNRKKFTKKIEKNLARSVFMFLTLLYKFHNFLIPSHK